MVANDLNWWLKSNAGLAARVGIGVAIFAALAACDLARKGRTARRWREYLFLLATAVAGVVYGAANDAITSAVSWEYFYFGKGLDEVLGPKVPPDPAALRWEAVKVGMKAAGSAGLVAGAVLLLANTPSRRRPEARPLSFCRLRGHLAGIALLTAVSSAALGTLGYVGGLSWMSNDLEQIELQGLFRPARFQCVYGIHLGSYAGGILGTVIAAWRVQRERASLTEHAPQDA